MKKFIPILFVFLWSTGFIGTKYGLMYAGTGDFLTVRALASALIFAGLIFLFNQKKLTKVQVFHAMVTGLLIHGAYLGGVYVAIEMGLPAGLTAIIVGLQPLLTALIAMIILKERLNASQWSAMVLGLFGLALVVSNSAALEHISLSALTFACIALFGITIGTIYQKRFCQNQELLVSVFWQYFACLLVFVSISFWQQAPAIQWQAEFIFSLTWLVIVLSVAAILLLLYMIENGSAAKVSAYFYLVPPVTAFEAWLMFDETLTIPMIAGMLLCALSVFVIIRSPKQL